MEGPSDKRRSNVVRLAIPFKERAFIPLSGNPENGNYADWYEHLEAALPSQEAELVPMPISQKRE